LRHLFFLLWLLSTNAQALPGAVIESLKQAGIPLEAVAIDVRNVTAHKSLLSLNAATAMNPASTMKLLTTYAALDLLGPAYIWKTEAYLDGELKDGILYGNLVLKGYGDPKLTIEQFWLWLSELRSRGLREIRGDLVLDRNFFELSPQDPGAFDNDPTRAYNVAPDALLLNFNTLNLRYIAENGRLKVFSVPPLEGLKLDNRLTAASSASGIHCDNWNDNIQVHAEGDTVILQGAYPIECTEREQRLSVLTPAHYLDSVFRSLWHELGGSLQGKQRDGIAGVNAKLYSTHYSEPLSLIIRDINKYSNNVMARQLFMTLSAVPAEAGRLLNTETPASLGRSIIALQAWLTRQKLYYPELVLENGAGLSRNERISAAHLAQLLQHAALHPLNAEFQATLPILGVDGSVKKRLRSSVAAGHAHLKTGTLAGVKTLAGYVRSQDGREWVVVFLINHPNAKYGQAAQDSLIEWVQRQ
jgi:serine-type D-Ala-D-Ala carboxypeptidase/endopeptidase (penicillin-binding protein 4)